MFQAISVERTTGNLSHSCNYFKSVGLSAADVYD